MGIAQGLIGSFGGAAAVSPITLVAHAAANASGILNTTGAINTTGATLLVMWVPWYGPSGVTPPVSDSKSNTWVQLTEYASDGANGSLWYVKNPTVGSGHTFTEGDGNSRLAGIAVAAFNLTDTTANVEIETGAHVNIGGAATVATGSLTPTSPNSLVVSGFGYFDQPAARTASIDSGFTITDTIGDAASSCVALAYKVQTAAAAVNPTWTAPQNQFGLSTAIAAFKHA